MKKIFQPSICYVLLFTGRLRFLAFIFAFSAYASPVAAKEVIIPVPHEAQKPIAGSGGKQKVIALIHDPQYDAHECISVLDKPSLYGGFVNSCNFSVAYSFCAYHPKKDSWAEAFDCENSGGGAGSIRPNGTDASITKGAESIKWAACMDRDANGKYVGSGPYGIAFDAQKKELVYSCNVKNPKERAARQKDEQAERDQLAREEQAKAELERQKQQMAQQKEQQAQAERQKQQAKAEQVRVAQQISSPSGTNPTTKIDLPKPVKGAIDAPVIRGSNTNGPTQFVLERADINVRRTIHVVVPEAWKSRTLTISPNLAHLKPVDLFLGFVSNYLDVNGLVGRTFEEALRNSDRSSYWTEEATVTSCSQVLGRTTTAWAAYLSVMHQLPYYMDLGKRENNILRELTDVMVCGAASMEEALATAYDQAKLLSAGKPFMTYLRVETGVTAEVGSVQSLQKWSLGELLLIVAPWTTYCIFPEHMDAAEGGLMPQDPGSGKAFAEYIKSVPEGREYQYSQRITPDYVNHKAKRWLGCQRNINTPDGFGPPPVFPPR